MLKCENIAVKNILDGVSFSASKNSFTAIIGKNGSGKTTLAKCIMEQIKHGGYVLLDGMKSLDIPPSERAKKTAYLPQMLPSPNITVFELAAMGRTPYASLSRRMSEADILSVENALALTDMLQFKNRFIPSLSGGEKQRAFLAMMLAQDADILLLDEPTAYMDMSAAAEFTSLLAKLDKTLTVIMHDLSLAVKYADNILVLDGGKQAFFGSKNDCLESRIIEKSFDVRRIENNGETVFLV